MKTKHTIKNASQLATRLQKLRKFRRKRTVRIRSVRVKRQSLTENQRNEVFLKTNGQCHICGGKILKDEAWQADHVIAHAQGGIHEIGNYLPAWFSQGRLTRFEVHGVIAEILAKTACFATLHEVKAENS